MYSCHVRLLNNSLKINHHPAQSSTRIFSNDANNNFGQLNKKILEVEAAIILSGKKISNNGSQKNLRDSFPVSKEKQTRSYSSWNENALISMETVKFHV